MAWVNSLRCRDCKREYPVEPINVCEFCFAPLEVKYDYDAIGRVISRERIEQGPRTMWRYQDLLPVDVREEIDLHTGFTPLTKATRLGRMIGLDELYIKNDAVNPSFSFKDRVVAVAITKALEFGYDTIACASTGNLAGSVAAHAAKAGMKAFIFIPADLEQGKVIGAAIYGPTDKPRYLMGAGSPEDLVEAVAVGYDLFDCALPTRVARNGGIYTRAGRVDVTTARFRGVDGPLEEGCDCLACNGFSTGYIHHLFKARELLAHRLGTIHNLRFFQRLMAEVREAVEAGTMQDYRQEFMGRYTPAREEARMEQRQRRLGAQEQV